MRQLLFLKTKGNKKKPVFTRSPEGRGLQSVDEWQEPSGSGFRPTGNKNFGATGFSRWGSTFKGQSLIESTFAILVICLLILSMVKVFFWVGTDLANRSMAHQKTLVLNVLPDNEIDNYRQIRPTFYEGTPMDGTTINSEIFGLNRPQ